MNNEVTIEEYDKNLRCTTKMASGRVQFNEPKWNSEFLLYNLGDAIKAVV